MRNNDTRIYLAAVAAGFSNEAARLVVAQARHETGNYQSHVYTYNNNLFGMRPAAKRKSTRLSKAPTGKTENGYAFYKSLEDSVADLALWFENMGVSKNIRSVEDYASQIKQKGYFEASLSEYMSGMYYALNKLEIDGLSKA